MKIVIFATLTVGALAGAPAWLPQAGLGFLEGFMSEKQADVDMCIVGLLSPMGDIKTGIVDIKAGVKDRNLTELEEGVAALRQAMQKDLPAAMEQCKAAKADLEAIKEVLKGFHGLKDIIAHVKADIAADDQGKIMQELELMARSFEEKKYDDFGRFLGQMLHRLVIGPEGTLRAFDSIVKSCSGSGDPSGTFPMCYEGKAGALGITEDVKVKLLSYASGKGSMDLTGSGIESISCQGKSFTKSGQDISPEISDCLPSKITIKSVEYCSDQDTVSVTVKDSAIFFPVSATLTKVACGSTVVV